MARQNLVNCDTPNRQIVLITDGEAEVDPGRVEAARRSLGELSVGVSVSSRTC